MSQTYEEKLRTLSEGSVERHFDPFVDIAWDDPEMAIRPDDERFILPEAHELGRHPWYQSLSDERKIEIGRWQMAQMAKVGLHFENLLIRGLMEYCFTLPNGSPEFRYVTHEATEETQHTQMFQEFVNRAGVDVPGIRRWTVPLQGIIPRFATWFPEFFFTMVLGGEEPIDHMQKVYLRAAEGEIHPLMTRIMQIHVAEEARHISFAHEFLVRRVPQANRFKRFLLAILTPLVMRIMCDMIITPSRKSARELGMPRSVRKDLYWRGPESRVLLSEVFGDVRMLFDRCGIRSPWARVLWRWLGIEGEASRYRGEIHDRSLYDADQAA